MAKRFIGIDIGSTASKVCVLEEGKEPIYEVLPTGWNSKITDPDYIQAGWKIRVG